MRKYDLAQVNIARMKASDLRPRTENAARIPKGLNTRQATPRELITVWNEAR